MVDGLLAFGGRTREGESFLSWTRARKKASSFYGNVGEEEKWISWRCCAPSAGVSSAIEQIQLLSQAWELAEGSLSIGASA